MISTIALDTAISLFLLQPKGTFFSELACVEDCYALHFPQYNLSKMVAVILFRLLLDCGYISQTDFSCDRRIREIFSTLKMYIKTHTYHQWHYLDLVKN